LLNKSKSFSIKNKFITLLLTLALIAWRSYSVKNLPLDALPDVTNNQVQIITTAPTLASQEVEQLNIGEKT
jgi:heavy metal efflux system protein